MRINVSRIRDWLRCPTYEHYRHRLRRVPVALAPAREIGTVWHRAMESYFREGSHPAALRILKEAGAELLPRLPLDKQADARNALTVLEHGFNAWTLPDGWRVQHVEQELEIPLGAHTLFGRPDAVIEWQDDIWHVQHKTAAGSTSLPLYHRGLQRSWHESAYNRMIEVAFGRRPAGTIAIVARKLSLKRAQETPAAIINVEYLPIAQHVVEKALEDLEQLAGRIDTFNSIHREVPTISPVQNRDSCIAFNSICDYIDVCEKRAQLTGLTFEDVVDRP